MRYIIQEKAKFITKSTRLREDQLHCMVFGSDYNQGLVSFIE
jgi:hypothetical protein